MGLKPGSVALAGTRWDGDPRTSKPLWGYVVVLGGFDTHALPPHQRPHGGRAWLGADRSRLGRRRQLRMRHGHGLVRLDELPVSLRLIREIHGVLLKEVRGVERIPGEFRPAQSWVDASDSTLAAASHVPPPSHEMQGGLGDLGHSFTGKTLSPNGPQLCKCDLSRRDLGAAGPAYRDCRAQARSHVRLQSVGETLPRCRARRLDPRCRRCSRRGASGRHDLEARDSRHAPPTVHHPRRMRPA